MLYVFNRNNQVQIAWNGKVNNAKAPKILDRRVR